jgi:O-antigen/teichoic acid export membrane protein
VRAIAIQGAGAAFNALVSFVLLVMLGRAFGAESFGAYVALLSAAVLGLILIEGGWPTRLYRETVDGGASPEAGRQATRHAVAHVTGVGLVLCLAAWLLGGATHVAAAMAFGCMILLALSNLVSARMRGRGRFAQDTLWQCSGRLASAALILIVVSQLPASAEVVFSSWAVAVGLLLLFWGRAWLAPPRWRGLPGSYRHVLPFLAIDGASVFLLRADMSLLGALHVPAVDLSFYAAGTRFSEAAVLLFAGVTNVLLRTLRLHADDPLAFARELRFALALALGAGGLALVASVLLGEAVMTRVFGPDFRAAGALLPWISASLPLILTNLVLVQAAAARGRESQVARSLLLACVLLAAGLALGNQWHGIRGAAAGALAAHGVLFLLLGALVRRGRRTVT